MARTHGELIDELTKRVDALALALEGVRTVSTVEIAHLKDSLKDLQATTKEAQQALAKPAERVASLEQRCAALEKQSDRGWQLWLAALGFGFGLLSLLITAAIQLRKQPHFIPQTV